MIPHRFHWIWLGEEPLPADCREWIDGWERMHPRWERRLWTDANRPTLRNEKCFLQATTLAQRADILRYEVLHGFGGVYLDTDMECLRSVDSLLEGIEAFAGEEEPGQLAIGIIGAVEGHPWLEDVIAQLPESMREHAAITRATGPGFLTDVTKRHPEVKIFPPEIFYPYAFHEPSRAGGPFPSAYAVHRWHASWIAPEDRFVEDFPRMVERDLRPLLPKGARVITLAEGIDLDLPEHPTLPFTGRESYWGQPEDSDAALAELDRLRAMGWNWLVVLEPAYWWFDFYDRFLSTVERRASAVHRGRRFVAFELPCV